MKKYKFSRWYIWNRILYYFYLSWTIPARIYCLLKGYNYKKWIWEQIEKDYKKKKNKKKKKRNEDWVSDNDAYYQLTH